MALFPPLFLFDGDEADIIAIAKEESVYKMSDSYMNVMSYIQIALGAYLLYCGIANRGRIFDDQHIHKSKKEQYHRFARFFCLSYSPIAIVGGICELLGASGAQPWAALGIAGYILSFALIIALVVQSWRLGADHVQSKPQKKN